MEGASPHSACFAGGYDGLVCCEAPNVQRSAIKLGEVPEACRVECQNATAQTVVTCVNACRAKECEKQVASEPMGSHPVDFIEKCKAGLVAPEDILIPTEGANAVRGGGGTVIVDAIATCTAKAEGQKLSGLEKDGYIAKCKEEAKAGLAQPTEILVPTEAPNALGGAGGIYNPEDPKGESGQSGQRGGANVDPTASRSAQSSTPTITK